MLRFSNVIDLVAKLHQGRSEGAALRRRPRLRRARPDDKFFLCHRLAGEEDFCLGDLDRGVDQARARRCLSELAAPRRDSCSSCWARSLCAGGCHYENHLRENRLGLPAGTSCDFILRWLELGIQVYASLRRAPKDVFAFLERRADQ